MQIALSDHQRGLRSCPNCGQMYHARLARYRLCYDCVRRGVRYPERPERDLSKAALDLFAPIGELDK